MGDPDATSWWLWLAFAGFVFSLPAGMFFILFPASLIRKVEDPARQQGRISRMRLLGVGIILAGIGCAVLQARG